MKGDEIRGRAAWYARRLRAMDAGEVVARAGRQATHLADAAAWHVAPPLWRRTWMRSDARILNGEIRKTPRSFLTRERVLGLRERFPMRADAIVEAAEEADAGSVRFFGYPDVRLSRPIDFRLDALTRRTWPDRHGKLIDYRSGGPGDPKWIWELNRLQHLPLLVEAWLLTAEERFAKQAARQSLDWVASQPPGRGIAWSSGFEAGIRALSLGLTFDALRGQLTDEQARVVLRALDQHARWILRDPSTHSSANNHAVGELAGLAAISLLAPELRDADAWRTHALRRLGEEAERQILPDGTGAEQAFAYHLFALDLFLVVVALLDCALLAPPREILCALERSGEALWAQLGAEDPVPTYGDADDGHALRLEAGARRDARGVAASIAARLGDGRARTVARGLDATAWLLFGDSGAETFARTPPAPMPGSVALRDGGLVVLREAQRRIMVDVGPLGYLSIAAHGHADALQVTLAESGRDLVVDPGAGSYFGRPERRKPFRGTAFHPTVTVDARDQSEPGGPFLWLRHGRAWATHVALEDGVVVGEHDGYAALSDPVRHRRAVAVCPGGSVLVFDRLEGTRTHHYRQSWPLAPSLDARSASPATVEVTDAGQPRLAIALAASRAATLRLVRGSEDPFEGWFSPGLEAMVPSWTCSWEAEGEAVELAALFVFAEDALRTDLELSLHDADGRTAVEFKRNGERFACCVDLDAARPVEWLSPSTPVIPPDVRLEGARA
jgi:hypothetical protein